MPLELDFNEEQEMLREMVRGVCSSASDLQAVRDLEDDPTGFSRDFWAQLAELDLLGLLLPAEYGGSGMSMIEGVVVYEELGRSLAPTPHFVSCVLGAGALVEAGSDAQKSEWLPQMAKGDAILSIGWLEDSGGYRPAGIATVAEGAGDSVTLTGTKRHVFFAAAADRLVVLARSGEDVDLFLVDPSHDSVSMVQKNSIASDCQYDVTFAGTPAERIGDAGTGWANWHRVMLQGAILAAAQANGGAEYAQEITVQYAKDRHQFDKPLGAFQALQHDLADAQTALDGAKLLTYEAAWSHATGRPIRRLAPMVKMFSGQTYRDITAMAQQIWGGVGFTNEYDIQLFFRRAKSLQINWWDTQVCEELVAAAVLDEEAVPA